MPLLGETNCRKVAAISHKFYNFTQFYSSAQLASVCRQVKVFHANYGHSNLIATKVTQETFWCKQPPGSTRQPIRESSLANRGYQVLNEWSLGLCIQGLRKLVCSLQLLQLHLLPCVVSPHFIQQKCIVSKINSRLEKSGVRTEKFSEFVIQSYS